MTADGIKSYYRIVSNFEDALRDSKLGETLLASPYARYGNFTEETADLIVEVHGMERISPNLLAVTILNESTFNLYQEPNTNGNDTNWFGFDIGCGQLNLGWTTRMSWQGEFKTSDLLFVDVFGKPPYLPKMPFTGNPLAHLRAVARRLLGKKVDDRNRAILYTGPNAQPYRATSYDKYAPLFKDFFDKYARTV